MPVKKTPVVTTTGNRTTSTVKSGGSTYSREVKSNSLSGRSDTMYTKIPKKGQFETASNRSTDRRGYEALKSKVEKRIK